MPATSPATSAQELPLISRDVAKGQGSITWPPINPPPVADRSPNYFLKWIPCVIPLAFIGWVIGFFAMNLLTFALFVAWVVLGGVLVAVFCYWKSWNWSGGFFNMFTYLGYQSKLFSQKGLPMAGPETLPISGLLPIPPGGQLEKFQVDYAVNIAVPKGSQEEFGRGAHNTGLNDWVKRHLSKLPMSQSFDTFADDEDPVAYVMDRLGSVYPTLYQEWDDKKSDEALMRFCVHGLAAHRVQVQHIDGKKYYCVKTNGLARLPAHEGYERYGGDAYFDENWRVAFISDLGLAELRPDGSEVPVRTHPGDKDWDRAKFRFRSSLSVLVTFVDHLYAIHLQVSNLLVTSLRENLEPDHPVRRFLVPFTYMSIDVNDTAYKLLVKEGGYMSRCFALTHHGMKLGFSKSGDLLRSGIEKEARASNNGRPIVNKAKYYEFMKEQGIDTPYFQYSAKYWKVVEKFVATYLESYYEDDASFLADAPLVMMIRQLVYQMHSVATIDLNSDVLLAADTPTAQHFKAMAIEMLTLYIWQVTAGHEQVGTIASYVQDVSFCSFKWCKGASVGTKQVAIAQGMLMASTSMPMPPLMGSDWTHLFPPATSKSRPQGSSPHLAFHTFQAELQALSAEIDEWNAASATRPYPWNYPMYVFDPKLLETSVNV